MPNKPENAKPLNVNSARPKEDRSHYGSLHQKLRLQVLKDRPICEICQKAWSKIAHHLVYPALDVKSYQATCEPCHKNLHKS